MMMNASKTMLVLKRGRSGELLTSLETKVVVQAPMRAPPSIVVRTRVDALLDRDEDDDAVDECVDLIMSRVQAQPRDLSFGPSQLRRAIMEYVVERSALI